jgi:hypothetical protein
LGVKQDQDDLRGVFAVSPLARRDTPRSIDFVQNELIVKHISSGGFSRFIYGGNALAGIVKNRPDPAVRSPLNDEQIEALTPLVHR